MQSKRGQITIFIIIAIVIVAAVLIVLVLRPKIVDYFMSEQRASQVLASQVEPLRDSIASCTKQVSLEFFNTIGTQAGYYYVGEMPAFIFAGNAYVIVMYKDTNKVRVNKLPSLSSIEKQYSDFLETEGYAKIDKCLNNFAAFKKSIDVEPGARTITAEIRDEAVTLKIDWPITIKKQTITKTITQTVVQKDVDLLSPFGRVWKVANDIVNCETQVDCKFEGIKIDEYIWDNPDTMRYLSFYPRSLSENEITWLLETVTYRTGEKVFRFYFGIKREP